MNDHPPSTPGPTPPPPTPPPFAFSPTDPAAPPAPPPPAGLWLFQAGGKLQGPVEGAELAERLRRRELPGDTLVRPADGGTWQTVREHPEFRPHQAGRWKLSPNPPSPGPPAAAAKTADPRRVEDATSLPPTGGSEEPVRPPTASGPDTRISAEDLQKAPVQVKDLLLAAQIPADRPAQGRDRPNLGEPRPWSFPAMMILLLLGFAGVEWLLLQTPSPYTPYRNYVREVIQLVGRPCYYATQLLLVAALLGSARFCGWLFCPERVSWEETGRTVFSLYLFLGLSCLADFLVRDHLPGLDDDVILVCALGLTVLTLSAWIVMIQYAREIYGMGFFLAVVFLLSVLTLGGGLTGGAIALGALPDPGRAADMFRDWERAQRRYERASQVQMQRLEQEQRRSRARP